jgi:hypothetical protein
MRKKMSNQTFWEIADYVKRRLFSLIRIETSKINYLNYEEYRERFEDIPNSLLKEWQKIEKEYDKVISRGEIEKLKGFLYETLFYYACLKTQTIFLDAELAEFGGAKFEESPPWFECIPLYDIIPNLHFIYEKGKRRRKVPQVKADFLITYVDDKGPSPPALIDVKSSEKVAKQHKEELGWQIVSAMRLGFIFQIAYPNPNLKSSYPTSLKEWVIKTPCSECKELSDDYRKCTKCGAEIFPFTIVDARYKLKELIEQLGKTYRGRF